MGGRIVSRDVLQTTPTTVAPTAVTPATGEFSDIDLTSMRKVRPCDSRYPSLDPSLQAPSLFLSSPLPIYPSSFPQLFISCPTPPILAPHRPLPGVWWKLNRLSLTITSPSTSSWTNCWSECSLTLYFYF